MLKVGDKVIVKDNSYSLKLTNSGLKRGLPGRPQGIVSPEYIIKAVGKKLPARQSIVLDRKIYNDTVIEHTEENEVYLIRENQLVKVDTREYKRVVKVQSEPPETNWCEIRTMPHCER